MAHVREHLCSNREPSSSYTLQRLHEKGVKAGEGRSCSLHGVARRHHNQLLMETVSLSTLRSTLRSRGEQTWSCPTCNDPDGDCKYWQKYLGTFDEAEFDALTVLLNDSLANHTIPKD